jgi:phosphatidate phosphatase APP1
MKGFIRGSIFCLLSLLFFPKTSLALKPDETAVFYPTDAVLVNGRWEIPVHGWIFEPEEDSAKRTVLLDLAKNIFDRPLAPREEEIFKKRAVRFLADSEEDKRITLNFCGEAPVNTVSTEGGLLFFTFSLPPGALCDLQNGWVEVKTSPEVGDQRVFTARSQLVETEGVSVVSDIDDTIKFSKVADKKALMANTFLYAFRAVDGMSILYRKWRDEGARFHYLSAGPWQLYEPLSEFLESEGFPKGSFYLKSYRFSPSGLGDLMNGPMDHKIGRLTALFERYPRRKFILVGDSGESDPEIYGTLARKHPEKVLAIFIREINGETADSERYKNAFTDIPKDRIGIFKNPSELNSFNLVR